MSYDNILLGVFTEILSCINNLYIWQYTSDFHLIKSNCPDELYWNNILQSMEIPQYALCHCEKTRRPLLISDSLELLWIVAPCYLNDCLSSIHMLGPMFLSEFSINQLEQTLSQRIQSISLKRELLSHLSSLPVLPHTTFMMLGTMLHYCLTKEHIHISDIEIYKAPISNKKVNTSSVVSDAPHGGGEYEALMLKLIEDGNLDYKNILSQKGSSYGRIGILAPENSFRQFQDEIIAAITLCSRAAIQGGLPRETALTLSDYYIQNIESASSIPEIANIKKTMQEDFTYRVHQQKQLAGYSAPVKSSINVIHSFITERLTMEFIAKKIGYTPYYLSAQFKKEMGIGIVDYIKREKIEYAKMHLKNSDKSVKEISELLNFSSPSYFNAVFLKFVGQTPKEYQANIL